jgi:cell division protein FtsB
MPQRSRPGARSAGPSRAGYRGATGAARISGQRGKPTRVGDRARSGGSGARPEPPRRAAGPVGTAKRLRAPEPRRLTGRAMVLGLVLLGLLLAYAYPVRVYLSQQAEIAALEDSQADQSERIDLLNQQAAKWNDPEYIKSQARKRLHMVLPGEKEYVVVDPSNGQSSGPQAPPTTAKGPKPWYGKLWSSVEAANAK